MLLLLLAPVGALFFLACFIGYSLWKLSALPN